MGYAENCLPKRCNMGADVHVLTRMSKFISALQHIGTYEPFMDRGRWMWSENIGRLHPATDSPRLLAGKDLRSGLKGKLIALRPRIVQTFAILSRQPMSPPSKPVLAMHVYGESYCCLGLSNVSYLR